MRTLPEALDQFAYHPATADTAPRHEQVREAYRRFVAEVWPLIPDGPEKTLAIRKLQESQMFANLAVALTAPAVEPGTTLIVREVAASFPPEDVVRDPAGRPSGSLDFCAPGCIHVEPDEQDSCNCGPGEGCSAAGCLGVPAPSEHRPNCPPGRERERCWSCVCGAPWLAGAGPDGAGLCLGTPTPRQATPGTVDPPRPAGHSPRA